MVPRGGIGLGVENVSCGPATLNLGPRGGQGLCEVAICLLEGGSLVADGGGHEFHLPPYRSEGGDEWAYLAVFSLSRF